MPSLQYQGCFDASAQSLVATSIGNGPCSTVVASVSLTGQAFGVFNTAATVNLLPSTAPAGTYRATVYLVVTTLFATNTTETITIGWTDDQQAQTNATASAVLAAGSIGTSSVVFRSNGTAAITYKPGVTGSAATAGAAAFSVILERLL